MTKKKNKLKLTETVREIAGTVPPPVVDDAWVTVAPGVTISQARTETGRREPPVGESHRSADATPAVVSIGKRLDKGHLWEIEPVWTERLGLMADAAGLPADKFLDSLLRRAWIGLPLSKRGGA